MSSALLLGLCNSSNRNLFNAKALSSIKVDMVTTTCLSDSLKVECQGGLCLAGALLGKTPVLISINNHVGALIKLDGPIVVVIGRSVKDLINELGGVTEVSGRCIISCGGEGGVVIHAYNQFVVVGVE